MHECDQINLMVRWIPTTSGAFAIGQPSLLSHLPILAITCSKRVNNARLVLCACFSKVLRVYIL